MPRRTGSDAGRVAVIVLAGAALTACATPRYATSQGPGRSSAAPPQRVMPGRAKTGDPYQVGGIWYVPREQPRYDEVGVASWYGEAFNMKATANGEIFDMTGVSAAHTTLPLPSIVEVTNLENGRKLNIRVNDRGPFYGGRIIDLSREAASQLGYQTKGTAKVRVRYVGPAPLLGRDAGVRYASAAPLPVRPPPVAAAPTPRAPAGLQVQVAEALPPPAAPVETRALPPLSPPPPTAAVPVQAVVSAASPPSLRIQAGSYASEANAERAASQLSATTGSAVIEAVPREGGTLYRVMLSAPSDEAEAYALRDRIAAIGFKDARVVQAF